MHNICHGLQLCIAVIALIMLFIALTDHGAIIFDMKRLILWRKPISGDPDAENSTGGESSAGTEFALARGAS